MDQTTTKENLVAAASAAIDDEWRSISLCYRLLCVLLFFHKVKRQLIDMAIIADKNTDAEQR